MARNGSGTHSLPAGNPVVAGTTITPTWANDTLTDLSTEVTDSLSRSGKGGMLAAFEAADGTVAAPGIAFVSEPSSGMYRAGAGDVRLGILGALVAKWTAAGLDVTGNLGVSGALTINGVGVPFVTKKGSDQSTTSGTLGNVTDLAFAVEANSDYEFEFVLRCLVNAAGGMGVSLTGPASPTSITWQFEAVNTGFALLAAPQSGYAPLDRATTDNPGVTVIHINKVRGLLKNGANAGTVQLQFRIASGTPTVTVYAGSYVEWRKLA